MVHELNITSLLNGDARRAIHTTRYSRYAVHRVESVAEHTFNTMTYASVIAHHLIEDGYAVNHGTVLNKALWHDTEEPAGTGDILRGVKHSSPQLLQLIEEYGRRAVVRVSEALGLGKWSGSKDRSRDVILEYWENSKDDTVEGQIVRVADCLSVISYLVEEYDLGNRTLGVVHDEVMQYFGVVDRKVKIPELQDLLREVRSYFEERVNYNNAVCPLCKTPTSR